MVSRSEMVGAIPACSWKAEAAVCGAFAWCDLYGLQLYHYNWLPWYSCIARPGAIMTLTVTLDKSQNESLYQATVRPRTSYLRYS